MPIYSALCRDWRGADAVYYRPRLDPQRLWKLRAAVFGGGALQW